MAFKLVCGKDPAALGIEQEGGAWDMDAFRAHIETCPECKQFARCTVRLLAGEGDDLVETANGFLKKKKTVGDLRRAVRKAKEKKGDS